MGDRNSYVLQVQNLNKSFIKPGTHKKEKVHAVCDANLNIEAGQIFGLIGASGSGKSTVVKLIFGLERPDKGKILYNNRDLFMEKAGLRKKLREKMGLVLQDPYNSLCPRFTVKQILAEPLIMHKKARGINQAMEMIKKTLLRIELEPNEYMDRYPHQLSGGERQRIAIGRALMIEPGFLALDEPTSMLDEQTKYEIIRLIKKIAEELQAAVLLVTHDLAMAAGACDRMAVMKDGKIVEIGDAEDITTKPSSIYTKKLLLASSDLRKYWECFKLI